MSDVTFFIVAEQVNGKTIYEVWQRNRTHDIEVFLAWSDTRAEARELLRDYAAKEQARKEAQP
ncbi:MAG: hypothetical protein FJ284_12420 [Planctomycetes bacterium]|nr:hypothetical protein [Planctomycetota bacterium]